MRSKLICAALLSGCLTGRLGAETNPAAATPLTLAAAQRLAIARNWDLLAAQSEVEAAAAQAIVAHEFPNPSLGLSVGKISEDGKHPNQGSFFGPRDYDSIAAINQLFEICGKRKSRQVSAQTGWEGARARLLDAKRTLDQAVATAYAAAAQAQANVSVLKESAASLRREADIAAARLQAGDISTADKSRIEISAQQLELDAQSAEAAAKTARISLELLMGVPKAAGDVTLADPLEELARRPVADTEVSPTAGRADLVAATRALEKAEADLRLQKAERIPDPTVALQYEHQPATQPNTIGLGVNFPLPLWNRNRGEIKTAEAARDQARTQVEKLKAQIAADIATARLSHDIALKRWQTYRDQLRPKSAQIRQTVAFAYERGGASLLDLLSAERDDNAIRLAALQAANDTVTAAAALEAATETITSKNDSP